MTTHGNDVALLRDLLVSIVKAYTFNHELLRCDVIAPTNHLLVFKLKAEFSDHRKIMGKQRQNLQILQRVMASIGKANGISVEIVVDDPFTLVNEPPPQGGFDRKDSFDFEPVLKIVRAMASLKAGAIIPCEAKNYPGGTTFIVHVPMDHVGLFNPFEEEAMRQLIDLFGNRVRRKFHFTIELV